MTNLLYLCSLDHSIKTEKNEPRQALLRIYGQPRGDIEDQLEIFNQLANANLGPRLYSSFDEGRLEEYFPSNPLSWTELTDDNISKVIAKKIAAIHKLNVRCLDRNTDWLLDKYNYYNQFIESSRSIPIEFSDDTTDSTKAIARQMMAIDFKLEIEYLSKLFEASKAQVVFSHNDLHQNNIILLHDSDNDLYNRIVLIDFEYCSYNYRTFDIANHLSEWCFDYNGDDYPYFTASIEKFPSETKQRQFLAEYISELESNNQDISSAISDPSLSQVDRLESLYNEMQPFFMGSNLLWAIWAIRGARKSKIKFGYWEMAKYKWDIYLMCKKQYESKFSTNNCNENQQPHKKDT